MATSYRTETFGGVNVCVSTEKCADSVEYCRELAKLQNQEVSDGAKSLIVAIIL